MSSSENTMRALKDLPMFVDRWQCRFGIHRWAKWSDTQHDISHFLKPYQEKHCVDCNKIKLRFFSRM